MDAKKFGKTLRSIREDKKMNVTEFAKKVGYSQPFISMLENGNKGIPKPETLAKLADGLEVPHDYMLYLAGVIDEDLYNAKVKTKKMIKELGEGIKKSYIDNSATLLSFAGFSLHELSNNEFTLVRNDGTGNTIRISKKELESIINDLLDYIEYKVKLFHNRLDDKDHFFMSEGELFIDESNKEGD